MQTSPEMPNRSRRFLTARWMRRLLFIGACLATLIVGFYVVENWRGQRAWKQFVRTAEARGEQFKLEAFIPPEITPADNFAATPFLAPLFDFVPGTQQWRDTNAVENIKAFAPAYTAASHQVEKSYAPTTNLWARPAPDLRAWWVAFRATNTSPGLEPSAASVPSENQLTNLSLAEAAQNVLNALEEADPVLAELGQALQRPHARFNLRYEEESIVTILLPHLPVIRRISSVLHLRASAHLALGRQQPAFEDTLLILRLNQALASEPLLISYLVRVAGLQAGLSVIAEGINQHQWTDAHLRSFQEMLARIDLLTDSKRVLRAEHAFVCGFIDFLRESPDHMSTLGMTETVPVPLPWQNLLVRAIPDGWFYFEQLNYSRLFQQYTLPAIDLETRRVNPQLCAEGTAVTKAISDQSPLKLICRHQMFVRLLMASFEPAIRRIAVAQTGLDAARVACAVERYRLARNEYPKTLESLQPEFLSTAPRDVISGQSLVYRPSEGGFVIYSVGWNGVDDGGKLAYGRNDRDPNLESGDWVWQ